MSRLSRRALLKRTAGGAAAILGEKAFGEPPPSRPEVPSDPTKIQGRGWRPLGERAPFERPQRLAWDDRNGGISTSPLQDLHGIIVPSDLHFERHHAGVPAIDPERYRLLVHGMVERPRVFTLAELKRFPSRSRICFIECSGNGVMGYRGVDGRSSRHAFPRGRR
jgi:sulfane dehydrogenase subunit SoxC